MDDEGWAETIIITWTDHLQKCYTWRMDKMDELIERLDEARAGIQAMLPQVDTTKDIYPNWKIQHLLAHMTGWDDAMIETLTAHINGWEGPTSARRGIDLYNAETVATRESVSYEQIVKEWQQTREKLKTILHAISQEQFNTPVVTSWGPTMSMTDFLETFIHHELEEHGPDIQQWLAHPDEPILGRH